MEYSRQEYLSGLPFPSPRNLPNLGIEPGSLALQADSLPFKPPEKLPYKGVHRAGLLQICCWPTPVLECSGNCLREQVSHPSHGASDSLGLRGGGERWGFFFLLLNFYFYFILLYNTVLVLPYIDMDPPRVYMRSQTRTPLPPPSA